MVANPNTASRLTTNGPSNIGNTGYPNSRTDPFVDPFDLMFMSPFDYNWPYGPLTRMDPMSQNLTSSSALTKPFCPLLSADLIESETDYQVHVDLPGVNKEDLDISFSDGCMTIKAERKEVQEVNSDRVHKVERSFGKVQRTMMLPKNADCDQASASLKDGVLAVAFPKREIKKTKKITVA